MGGKSPMESSVQHDRAREVQIKQEECFYCYGLAHQSCFACDKLDSFVTRARLRRGSAGSAVSFHSQIFTVF